MDGLVKLLQVTRGTDGLGYVIHGLCGAFADFASRDVLHEAIVMFQRSIVVIGGGNVF